MPDYHVNALTEALRRIGHGAEVAEMLDLLSSNTAKIAAQLQEAVLTEVPEFSKSRNPALLPELARHGREHIEEIVRLLREGRVDRFEFVQEHARRRAEQRFSLEATLHAYRSSSKVLSRWLREAATPESINHIVDFALEYTDAISTAFAATYSNHLLLLAEVAGDERSQLLKILLDGNDESDLRASRLLREAGFLEERQSFCVAIARSVDPTEMLDAPRARRLADAIERVVADTPVRRLIDVHSNKVTMVFAAVRRISGWTAPRASLAKDIQETLTFVGNAALIGVSSDVSSTSHVPTAYREAAAALELASISQRVVRFSEIPLPRLLLHFAAQEFLRVLPAWSGEFFRANEESHGVLIDTIRAYAAVDMNVLKAAQVLKVHPNTIYARFLRVADISGLDARSLHPLIDLLIICDCAAPAARISQP